MTQRISPNSGYQDVVALFEPGFTPDEFQSSFFDDWLSPLRGDEVWDDITPRNSTPLPSVSVVRSGPTAVAAQGIIVFGRMESDSATLSNFHRLGVGLEPIGGKTRHIVIMERETGKSGPSVIRREALNYAALHAALDFMRDRDEDEDMYIEPDTFLSARNVANLLCFSGVATPKVFSHGRESVVFTWQSKEREYYLTVGEGYASVIEMGPDGNEAAVGSARLTDGSVLGLVESLREKIVGGAASS